MPEQDLSFLEMEGHEARLYDKQYQVMVMITKLLCEKNWTRKTLAERMGIRESSLSRMLSVMGSNLTLETISKMEEALDSDLLHTPQHFENKFLKDREYREQLNQLALLPPLTSRAGIFETETTQFEEEPEQYEDLVLTDFTHRTLESHE